MWMGACRQTDILPEGKHGLAHTLGDETLLKHMGNNIQQQQQQQQQGCKRENGPPVHSWLVRHLVPEGTTTTLHLPLLRRRLHPCTSPLPPHPWRPCGVRVARASSPRTSSPKTVSSGSSRQPQPQPIHNHACHVRRPFDEWLKVTSSWRMRSRSPSPHNNQHPDQAPGPWAASCEHAGARGW
jgi:hypothetical protein